MKRLIPLLLFAAALLPLSAQTVKGTLSDSETGEVIPFANVVLEGTRYGAATDINGFYLINKMPEGAYTLRVRFVGYQEYSEPITIKKGETLIRNIALKSESKTLSAVNVTDNRIEERKIQTQVSVEKKCPPSAAPPTSLNTSRYSQASTPPATKADSSTSAAAP